jgi:accessory colonization factor AcfC
MEGKFTVYFEDPFWVGILEVVDNEKHKIGKVIFGSEPSAADIYEFTKNDYSKMKLNEIKIEDQEEIIKQINPKRMIKLAKKQQERIGIGTKSQLALKKIQENIKNEKKKVNKEKKIELEEKIFLIKQMKKKKKKKGH